MVRARDELLQVSKAVGFSESEHEFCLNECLARLLAGHLKVADQVFKVSCGRWREGERQTRGERKKWRERMKDEKRGRASLLQHWPLTLGIGCLNDLCVGGRVVCLDVGVNGLLHHHALQLGLGQQAPHRRLVAPLGKLVGSVQVSDVCDEDLGKRRKGSE